MIDLKPPPGGPVKWIVSHRATHSSCEVVAQTAYFAKQQAAVILGAEPGELVPVEMQTENVSER